MQTYQPMPLPLDETRESVSNESAEMLVVVQVVAPDQPVPNGKEGEESATEPAFASPRRQRQFTLPPWPTSQQGPEVTAPSPGQRLVPTRTDQVMYDFYDQERGQPGLPPPAQADQARESTGEFAETRQTASTASQAVVPPLLHVQPNSIRLGNA